MEKNSSKVVFTSHESKLYGAPRSLFLLIKSFCFQYNCEVITYGDGELVEALNNEGVKTTILNSYNKNENKTILNYFVLKALSFFSWLNNLCKIISVGRKSETKLIYVNTVAKLSPIIAGKIARCPVIVHVRENENHLQPKSILKKIHILVMVRLADKFICVSNSTRKLLEQVPGMKAPIEVIYNGIDPTLYVRDENLGAQIRSGLNIPINATVVGFIGNLSYRKGIDVFLDVANNFTSDNNLYFLVVGGTHERIKELEEKVVNNNVIFVPFAKDVKPYFSAIDIFSMTSRIEPFARVNLEAACMKCAIVATNVGGNSEIFTHNENALLVKNESVLDITSALLRFHRDDTLREELSSQARLTVENNFHIDYTNYNIISIIKNYLE